MTQLALLGVWHVHARDYTQQARSLEGVEILKVWDKNHEAAQAFAAEHDLETVAALSDILEDEAVDGVIICTETADHDEVIAEAARAGKGIFTEKTLAIGTEAAQQLADTIREQKVPFVISFPQLGHTATLVTHALLGQGMLGDVVKLRFRNAHGGKAAGWLPAYWYDVETAGGGALMDLGCHPVYLANALLGRPKTVSCTLSPGTAEIPHADDEATVVLSYGDDGAVQAILETSFVTPQAPRRFEVYGTAASVLADNDDVRVLGVSDVDGIDADGRPQEGIWGREADGEELSMLQPLEAFVELSKQRKSDANAPLEVPGYDLDAAVLLAEVLEASYVSAAEGRVVEL